jgi:type II secretory ATPase GspE/PulE/Tfp pilus assembly ATPase PilB-like protein/FixJ family two-component response regulator
MKPEDSTSSANAALLRFLRNQGALTEGGVQQVTKSERQSIFEALEAEGLLRERELAELLARVLRLPLIDLSTFPLNRALASVLKGNLAAKYDLIPIRMDDRTIEIATANPLDREAIKNVEFASGRRVRLAVATRTDLQRAIGELYRLDESIQEFLQETKDDEASAPRVEGWDDSNESSFGIQETEAPPVVKLADRILVEATSNGASDVHIEPLQDAVVVRYRIDGLLEEAFRFPRSLQQPLIGRFKIMARLDIAERRVPQDGRTKIHVKDRLVDFRVSSLPTHLGEKITLRILDGAKALRPLEELGLTASDLDRLTDAAKRPEGMILVTGPTGSGKTTTLYALLRRLQSIAQNIVTIENPVEYRLSGINQVDVNEKQGLTFPSVLRSVLRRDPDVILVGEIRDAETAQIAFQAAQTGHLVLSTLHTNDSAATVTRLIDLGCEPYVISSSLNLIVAQRLVRKVCNECGEPDAPPEESLRKLSLEDEMKPLLRRGGGCPHCRGTGYSGRVGLYEMLPISTSIARLIEANAGESMLREQARRESCRLLLDDAEAKLRDGETTVDEVLRVVQVTDLFPRCPSCRKEVSDQFSVCPHCSTALKSNCDGCRRELDPHWSRCPYCGTETNVGPKHTPRTFKALVVDDDLSLRHVVRETLEHCGLGLTVMTAQDGHEALALAAIDRPDVVVMDLTMPGLNGVETSKRMREDPALALVPILMLTAHDDNDHLQAGFDAGVDDYVLKPFRREELIARVRRMLERAYGRDSVLQDGAAPARERTAS